MRELAGFVEFATDGIRGKLAYTRARGERGGSQEPREKINPVRLTKNMTCMFEALLALCGFVEDVATGVWSPTSVCGAVAHRWAIMGPLCVKVRPGGTVAVLPSCACDCERDLSDPEMAFLGLLCDSTFCDLFDPFCGSCGFSALLSLNFCVRI